MLMEAFTYMGIWWLEDIDDAVGGVLSFSQEDGLRLSLTGTINPKSSIEKILDMQLKDTYPVILGTTIDGKNITLQGNTLISSKVTSPGFASQEFLSTMAFIGVHIHSTDKIIFPKISVRYTHLPEWYGRSGFQWTLPTNNEPTKIILNYSMPEDAIAEVRGGKIYISNSVNSSFDPFEPKITQSVYLVIEPKTSLSIDDYISQYLFPVQNFISLATNTPNAIRNINVYYDSEDEKNQRIQIAFTPVYTEPETGTKKLHITDMLFTLRDLSNFSDTLSSWLDISINLNIVCKLFFSNQYNPSKYVESRFINIMQAFELYYRHFSHHKLRDYSIQKSPQKSLSTAQIKSLVDPLDEILAPLIKNNISFARKVKATRDYYINYDARLQKKAVHGIELYWLTEILSIVLRFHFLLEMGFSVKKCQEIFSRNRTFQGAISFAHY